VDEFITNLPVYREAIRQTFYIVLSSLAAGGVLGLGLGPVLYATRPENLLGNRAVFVVVSVASEVRTEKKGRA
jgi:D-methionine transport system permease protein